MHKRRHLGNFSFSVGFFAKQVGGGVGELIQGPGLVLRAGAGEDAGFRGDRLAAAVYAAHAKRVAQVMIDDVAAFEHPFLGAPAVFARVQNDGISGHAAGQIHAYGAEHAVLHQICIGNDAAA